MNKTPTVQKPVPVRITKAPIVREQRWKIGKWNSDVYHEHHPSLEQTAGLIFSGLNFNTAVIVIGALD